MRIIKKILNTLLLLTCLSLLSACGGDGMGGTGIEPGITGSPVASDTLSRTPIPFREHGYANFETQVILAQEAYDAFIKDVNAQGSWNNKASFLAQLQAASIDFSERTLLIYRITENSGSNVLTPQAPTIVNDKVTVVIDREVPEVGTTDIAYYALAYVVKKDISEIVFDNGSTQVSVDLTEPAPTSIQGKLIKTNSQSLLNYFQESIKRGQINSDQFSVATPSVSPSPAAAEGVSSTNIQESGVDEADLIKTNGRYIYSVKKGASLAVTPAISGVLPPNNTSASDIVRIMDTQGLTGLVEVNRLSDDENPWRIKGLYLHEAQNKLIAISSENQNYYSNWFNSYYFTNQNTDLMLVDITEPSNASVTSTLEFDGQLVDSRRNGNILYMVLRNYPNYQYVDDDALATTTNNDFLPSYAVDNSSSQLLTVPENCYVEEVQQGSADIITLVAIDLSATTPQINSQCYVGSAEAIYASQNALYLATTRWDYQTSDDIAIYNNIVTTDIHKFAYDGLNFDYRGSGEVDGHLGFRQSSKSFRFSEHDDLLRVVTFDEDQWNFLPLAIEPTVDASVNQDNDSALERSPVVLSILRDDPASKSLKLVSKLPNENRTDPIGLPGEQLYASRFVDNRAYLVTFRVIDPFYVLDLSDPSDPKIAGELKIDGYSEYLHPINENLLLGIGKDAIPDESGGFVGNDGRGAWYQGVKLSLLDVSDPNNPREADKMILGKRGTESTALYTHHGVTGLKVNDDYRIAIPVRLHETNPQTNGAITPSTFYEYTHTGLYRFNIDTNNQTIQKIPALVVDNSSNQNYQDILDDRSVMINNDVFYLQNGDYWVQDWQGNNPVLGPR